MCSSPSDNRDVQLCALRSKWLGPCSPRLPYALKVVAVANSVSLLLLFGICAKVREVK